MTCEERLDKLELLKINFIEFLTNTIKKDYKSVPPLDRMDIGQKMYFYFDMENRIEA